MAEDTVRRIGRIFNASSVAVIGASNDPHKFGYMTLDSIIRGGYRGRIYPVNPKGGKILDLKAYPSLGEIPDKVEAMIVLVPAKFVPGLLREAVKRGVTGAVVCSGGFGEAGRTDLEKDLRSAIRDTGIRVIGPNVAGINYLPNRLCAMFFPVITTRGTVAVVSQSGTVTNALSEWASDDGMGISAAINLGNQVDLCESDFLDFLAFDENTRAIAMYLEGVSDGRRFLRSLARAITQKPVAVLKGGRTEAGKRTAHSHTGSLAANHEVFHGACRQCGALMADSLEALYDYTKALACMRPPKGNRVFSISSSGGAGTLAADMAESNGLTLPELPPDLKNRIQDLELFSLATIGNPFDTGADLDCGHFREAALLVDKSRAVDILFMNFGDPIAGATEMVEDLNLKVESSLAIGYFAGGDEEKIGRVRMHKAGFPVFPSPERAIRGIGVAVQDARFRMERSGRAETKRFPGPFRDPGQNVREIFLTEPEAVSYLELFGIPYPAHGLARDSGEAAAIAENLGYPVVLKVVSPQIVHKTEVGGVVTGISTPETVRKEYQRIVNRVTSSLPEAAIEGVLVCQQAANGLELIVGGVEDPLFGPTVMFGLGGVYAEIIRDVSFRVAPVDRLDAESMIEEIKGFPILMGARRKQAYAIQKLKDLICSVSRLIMERPEVKELDLNPVTIFEDRLFALDARIIRKGGAD